MIKKLVSLAIYLNNSTSISDNVYKVICQTIDIINYCIKNSDSSPFYLKSLNTELLKSINDEYVTRLLEEIENQISIKICHDIDAFDKIMFTLDCCQSLTLKAQDLKHLLEMLKNIGQIIFQMNSFNTTKSNDIIELLIIIINCAQSALNEAKKDKSDVLKENYKAYLNHLIGMFTDQADNLTEIYKENSKIDVTEGLLDPVQEFLQKDSLMTSAQKESANDVEMSEEDNVVQKDIILHQSLSALLIFISNMQHEVNFGKNIFVDKIFECLYKNMSALNDLYDLAEHSSQILSSQIKKLLSLQTSAFSNNIINSLKNEDVSITEYVQFINKMTYVYVSNVVQFENSFEEKYGLISRMLKTVPLKYKEKIHTLVMTILLFNTLDNAKIKFNEDENKAKIFEIENHEFKIAQKVLLNVMKSTDAIPIIKHFIMVMNYLPVFHVDSMKPQYNQTVEFIHKKNNLLFNNEYNEAIKTDAKWLESLFKTQIKLSKLKYIFMLLLEDILPKQSHYEKYGQDRHPLVRRFQELSINNQIDQTLLIKDLILAFDLGTTIIEHQQSIANGKFCFEIYNLYKIDYKKKFSSKNIKKVVQQKDEKKAIAKLSKSVERLVYSYRRFNQDFVGTLIPLKLYVPVVTSILDYDDELILLKTRSVNVLYGFTPNFKEIDKSTAYYEGHRLDSALDQSFSELIQKIGLILEDLKAETKQKAVQTYLQSLILLLQKLVCKSHKMTIQS